MARTEKVARRSTGGRAPRRYRSWRVPEAEKERREEQLAAWDEFKKFYKMEEDGEGPYNGEAVADKGKPRERDDTEETQQKPYFDLDEVKLPELIDGFKLPDRNVIKGLEDLNQGPCFLRYLAEHPSVTTLLRAEATWVMLSYHRWRLRALRPQTGVSSAEDVALKVDVPRLLLEIDALDQHLGSMQSRACDPKHNDVRNMLRVQRRIGLSSRYGMLPEEDDVEYGTSARFNRADDASQKAAVSELRDEVASLRKQVTDLNSKNFKVAADFYQQCIQQKRTEARAKQAEAKLQASTAEHERTVDGLQSEVRGLSASNARLRDEVTKLRAAHRNCETQRAELAGDLARAREEATAAREALRKLRKESPEREGALKEELAAAKQNHAQSDDDAYRAEVAKVEKVQASLRYELDSLYETAEAMRAAVEEQRAADARKRHMDDDADEAAGAGPSKRARIQEDLAESAEVAAGPGTSTTPGEMWYREQQQEITRLRQVSDDLQPKIQELQVRLATDEAERAALQARLTDTIERLNATIREREDSVSRLRTELQKTQTQVAVRDKDVTQVHNMNVALREIISELRSNAQHLRCTLDAERAEQQKQHKAQSAETATLREECSRLRAASEKARAEYTSLRGKLTNLLATAAD
ncbi:hypothetical protein PsYK624_154480 [Phanerochaete sordida]|uniref:Uncharacterized protein n=1 Tax=Phanerochaete sordida TaxID=48140 RepID=A0A9P3GTA0_9APHY|nr:hypothetical protein PsYK624_154480 [Phanerochaete sordida]